MAKKIRFPLEMENGIEVRSIEELIENFSLFKVLEYVDNGKLVIWLRDRYENDIADQIEQLDKTDKELKKRVSEIFGILYNEEVEKSLEEAEERAKKLKKLKEFTEEEKYEKVIDNIAFEQDDIYDLLDEGKDTIYLCGGKFSIPLSKCGVSYIGINKPILIVNSKTRVDWSARNISIEGVIFDEKYQKLLIDEPEKEKLWVGYRPTSTNPISQPEKEKLWVGYRPISNEPQTQTPKSEADKLFDDIKNVFKDISKMDFRTCK